MIFNTPPRNILNSRRKVYSLEGEEGVLEYLLDKIPNKNKWIVEFGACDGIAFSNSLYFINDLNYSAILIEPDSEQYIQLETNMSKYPNVHCLKQFITRDGDLSFDNTIDRLGTEIPNDFDLLIIDVDNNDYHLWDSIQKYNPKIVMIEINNTQLPTYEKIAEYDCEFIFGKHGSSIKSMTALANKKGYKLVANISCNAIYIKAEYYELFFHRDYDVLDFYTFEGICADRISLLSVSQILIKAQEAIRRDNVLSGKGFFKCAIEILIKFINKNN